MLEARGRNFRADRRQIALDGETDLGETAKKTPQRAPNNGRAAAGELLTQRRFSFAPPPLAESAKGPVRDIAKLLEQPEKKPPRRQPHQQPAAPDTDQQGDIGERRADPGHFRKPVWLSSTGAESSGILA